MCAKSVQSCLTLCNPMDCSPPGNSVHWILQARILECIAMPSSRWSSWPKDQTHISCLLHWWMDSLPRMLPGKSSFPLAQVEILSFHGMIPLAKKNPPFTCTNLNCVSFTCNSKCSDQYVMNSLYIKSLYALESCSLQYILLHWYIHAYQCLNYIVLIITVS